MNGDAAVLVPTGSDRLSGATTADLRAELARGLALTAETLTRLSAVWAELERRGEDLSALRVGLARTLPLIASGRLAAEAVVAFAGRPAVLRALEGVPPAEQRRLAAGGAVEVVRADDPARTEAVPLAALPAARLADVFADGAVLSPAEQRVRLAPRSRRRPAPAPDRRYRVRYDRDRGVLRVGNAEAALADVLDALAAGTGPDRPVPQDLPDEYRTATAKLHPDEKARLAAACKRANLPEWEVVRKALRAYGLI